MQARLAEAVFHGGEGLAEHAQHQEDGEGQRVQRVELPARLEGARREVAAHERQVKHRQQLGAVSQELLRREGVSESEGR